MRTSVGSLSLLGTYPVADATVIGNIKHQGGIIIAKSSMNELAAGIDGVSGLSGRIGNAYNSDYTSGGSSGGSAVGVAAGFAPISIGSDNSGSIRIPAAFNGIYGLRPTYGLISVNGVFPMGNLDGTIGPMASNVENLARFLTVMVNNSTNYEQSLNSNSLRMKRFAVVRSVVGRSLWNDMPKPVNEIYKRVFNNMRSAGVVIVDIDLPKFNLDRTYNMAGTLDDVHQYLLHNISSISQLQDVCYGNSRVFGKPSQCAKFLGSVKAKNGPEYQAVKQMIASNQRYIEKLMKEEHLDGLVFPSGKSGIADSDWHKIGDAFVISSNSGLPEITIPVGQLNGLPVGMEILGVQNSDSNLLNYAYAYQQHFYKFKAPKLVADYSFNHCTLQQLNLLYPLIGMTSFNDAIKIENKNVEDAKQSIIATKKAVAKAKLY